MVLAGAGPKSFIVGADINEMAGINNAEQARAFITRLHQCCDAIRNLPVPVIARIHGYCFGGGLEIAAACDVRIASDAASFGMQEVKLGIPSVIEAALLPTLVGWGRAREIMLLGETFTAAEALAWRLVERVVPAAALDARGRSLDRQTADVKAARCAAAKAADPAMGGLAARRPRSQPASMLSPPPTRAMSPPAAMREFLAAQRARKRAAELKRRPPRSASAAACAPGTRRSARARSSPRNLPGSRRPWRAKPAAAESPRRPASVAVLASHPATPESDEGEVGAPPELASGFRGKGDRRIHHVGAA